MRRCRAVAVAALAAAVYVTAPSGSAQRGTVARTVRWADVAPLHRQLVGHGLTATTFVAYIERTRTANIRRVREGELDHLVFYLLQSTRFTTLPAIEPALSAKAFVETGRVPDDVRPRVAALVRALDAPSQDPRLAYFRHLVTVTFSKRPARQAELLREYERVMRFVYEKEFVAQRSPRAAEAVADLYRRRGLSTDTAVEAGYLVYQGLAVLKALEPDRRIRRVLIVGPGLDLAPRTGLVETGPPESYQPWAVIDALLGLGLATSSDLQVVGADINPRVVAHLRRAHANPPVLTLTTGIRDVRFSDEYRRYFWNLGTAIGTIAESGGTGDRAGYESMRTRVRVRPDVARLVHAQRLDVVTERLVGPPFDLVIATNILPYFGDVDLMLAMTNIASMLAPGGVFLHNEPRPSLGEIATALDLRFEQARHATIATVRGAPPLADTVFLHRKAPDSQLPAPSHRLRIRMHPG